MSSLPTLENWGTTVWSFVEVTDTSTTKDETKSTIKTYVHQPKRNENIRGQENIYIRRFYLTMVLLDAIRNLVSEVSVDGNIACAPTVKKKPRKTSRLCVK